MRRLIDRNRIYHVVPLGDLIEHDDGPNGHKCICDPKIEPVEGDDPRTVGALVTHNALDGRERYEHDHDEEACPLCRDRASGETP